MATASSTFDDPPENPLSEGAVFDNPATGFGGNLQKTGGAVRCSATSADCMARHSLVVAGDHYSRITISGGSGTQQWGVATRIQSNGNCYAVQPFSTTQCSLYRVVGSTGGFTTLATLTGGGVWTANDTIELRSIGTTHTPYHNGVAMTVNTGSLTDANYSGGNVGMVGFQTILQDLVTAWQGGDFAATPSLPPPGGVRLPMAVLAR